MLGGQLSCKNYGYRLSIFSSFYLQIYMEKEVLSPHILDKEADAEIVSNSGKDNAGNQGLISQGPPDVYCLFSAYNTTFTFPKQPPFIPQLSLEQITNICGRSTGNLVYP